MRHTLQSQRLGPGVLQWIAHRWLALALLALAVALAVPAALAIYAARGEVFHALHGNPRKDAARYSLFGSVAAAAVSGLLIVRSYRQKPDRLPSSYPH